MCFSTDTLMKKADLYHASTSAKNSNRHLLREPQGMFFSITNLKSSLPPPPLWEKKAQFGSKGRDSSLSTIALGRTVYVARQ